MILYKLDKYCVQVINMKLEQGKNTLRQEGGSKVYGVIKRLLDLVFAAAALLLGWWLLGLIALAILLEDGAPVIFRQKRVGRDGKLFEIMKFRTMRKDTPRDVPTHLLGSPQHYITKTGRFLRKASLDELPQVFNILAGQMSFVGPRPALYNQTDLNELRRQNGSDQVRPGLTGWAQIHGRDELEIGEKADLDGFYTANLGLKMDIKCFFGTFLPVLRGQGVVEGGTGTGKDGQL